jgi:hypothetical protein
LKNKNFNLSFKPGISLKREKQAHGEFRSSPEQVLGDDRKQCSIGSFHYIIDWNYDEDRCQIRTGHGPENITRLGRFAIGLLKSKKSKETIPEKMKKLMLNRRAVFAYLKMTRNFNYFVAHKALA